jgi:hypothetical protein
MEIPLVLLTYVEPYIDFIRGCIKNIPDCSKNNKTHHKSYRAPSPSKYSLPHSDTGSTVSFIFGTFPGNPCLSECQALSEIRPESLQWYQTGAISASALFLEIVRNHRGVRWVGKDSHFVFRQKLLGEDGSVRLGVVMVKQPGLFSPNFGEKSSHFFKKSPQNVVVEFGIHSLAGWETFCATTTAVQIAAQVRNILGTLSYSYEYNKEETYHCYC